MGVVAAEEGMEEEGTQVGAHAVEVMVVTMAEVTVEDMVVIEEEAMEVDMVTVVTGLEKDF